MTGYCDLQVNGYAGIDFNDADITPDGVDRALGRTNSESTLEDQP